MVFANTKEKMSSSQFQVPVNYSGIRQSISISNESVSPESEESLAKFFENVQ